MDCYFVFRDFSLIFPQSFFDTFAIVCPFFSDVTSILLRVSEQFGWQLSQATGTEYKETEPDIDSQVREASESETDRQRDLMQRLVRQMGRLAKAGKTPVLVIDGLDKEKRGKLDKVSFYQTVCWK